MLIWDLTVKKHVKKVVSIGDSVLAATDITDLADGKIAGRALDDRFGAFIILEALKKQKKRRRVVVSMLQQQSEKKQRCVEHIMYQIL